MAEPKPPPSLPISTTSTGSHLPVIPKKAAENEVKRVKGGRCGTPEMQRRRQRPGPAGGPWVPLRQQLLRFGYSTETKPSASKLDLQPVSSGSSLNQPREDETLDFPRQSRIYKKRQHERIARLLKKGIHLVMKHEGDKKQNE